MRQITISRALLCAATFTLAACSHDSKHPTGPSGGGTYSDGGSYSVSSADEGDGNLAEGRNDVQIVRGTGDITGTVEAYRATLGQNLSPNAKGEQPGDRREINWDGVKPELTNNDAFPGDFFNTVSPRGVLFTTNGTGFHISDKGYIEVNPNYAGEFNAFSPKKLFVSVGGTIIDVQFVVAGSNTPATVTGFGSVFEDVGRANSTTIEYFDAAGNRLLKIAAPRASDDRGLSFAGATFASRIVSRVRITVGDTPIGADVTDNVKGAGPKRDIVATDDFIYGEPRVSIPN